MTALVAVLWLAHPFQACQGKKWVIVAGKPDVGHVIRIFFWGDSRDRSTQDKGISGKKRSREPSQIS